LLRLTVPAARNAIPTIAGVQALVPSARKALEGLPPVIAKAVPAVTSLTGALKPLIPVLAGLRVYAPDVVGGFFNGVGGASGASYDANGHYIKSLLALQAGGASLTGLLTTLGSLLGSTVGAVTGLNGARSHLTSTCPGGGAPPAGDGSNPWANPDVLPGTGTLCDPADNEK
jgi:hypothetical protein